MEFPILGPLEMLADGTGTLRKLSVKCRESTSAMTLQSGKGRHMHLTQTNHARRARCLHVRSEPDD